MGAAKDLVLIEKEGDLLGVRAKMGWDWWRMRINI